MSSKKLDQPPGLPVILVVRGGVAHVLFKPASVMLSIYDYDWEAADSNDPSLSRDPDGHVCLYQEYGPAQAIIEQQHWPVIRNARRGTYTRTWKCSRCGQTTSCSYEYLANAGVPMCTDCDVEMDLQ